jgi:phospholipid/cholesterol/gamma-HCH transport system substrate-binding protein
MSTEAKVGAFVIVCLMLLGITLYYVANAQWGGHLTPYKTYLRYAGGINSGTEVLFGGISAGRVTSVRAWTGDPTQIEVLLEVKEGTPVNENSVARLGTVSLMSTPAVSITTGTRDAKRLEAGRVIRSEETVSIDEMARKLSGIAESAQGLVTQVQSELTEVSGNARTLLANLNEITGPANRRQVALLLQQANSLVATQSPKIDRLTSQVLLMSRNADSVIGKIGPLVDHADGTVSNLNATIDQLRDPIRQELAQLQSTTEQAKSLIAAIQAVVRANDRSIGETVENLRAATENLNQLSGQIKQRPWSLVRIRQPEDRKVPRESGR